MIIGVINTKGGSAKTTTATNLAVVFANKGYKVCLLDTDAGQESSRMWVENRPEELPTVRVEVVSPTFLATTAKALEKEGYLVFVDSAPKLSDLANLIIVASDILIIPVQPTYYDFRGFENFLENFRAFKGA
ncbi:ParA family protein, partial [Saprospiraceae bacterium]|nr:ParA family protein [Saprospiraceae bacterium]